MRSISKSRVAHESDSETLLFVDSIQDTQARALWLDLYVQTHSSNQCNAMQCKLTVMWLCSLSTSWQYAAYSPCTTNCESVNGKFLRCTYAEAVSYVRCVRGENQLFLLILFVLRQTAKQNWFPPSTSHLESVAATLQMLISIFDYKSFLACYRLITTHICVEPLCPTRFQIMMLSIKSILPEKYC